jgi:hypothetical protein
MTAAIPAMTEYAPVALRQSLSGAHWVYTIASAIEAAAAVIPTPVTTPPASFQWCADARRWLSSLCVGAADADIDVPDGRGWVDDASVGAGLTSASAEVVVDKRIASRIRIIVDIIRHTTNPAHWQLRHVRHNTAPYRGQ